MKIKRLLDGKMIKIEEEFVKDGHKKKKYRKINSMGL